MKTFFEEHLYLYSLLIFGVIYLSGIFVFRKYLKSILFASVTAFPHASFALILDYWKPEKISIFGIGLEDFIFCFLAGGITWICTLVFISKRLQIEFRKKNILRRLFICLVFGILSVTLLNKLNVTNYLNKHCSKKFFPREHIYPLSKYQ